MLRTPQQMREAAAELVDRHATRFGMDPYAASLLVDVLRGMRIDDGQPDADGWIQTEGRKPDLAGIHFVIARYEGETREEAESHRDGYGEPVDTIGWSMTIEYREKDRSGQ